MTTADRARNALGSAVARGDVVRPDRCSRCEKRCRPHGHHTDYLRPLDVVWLCARCHFAEHPTHASKSKPVLSTSSTPLASWMRRNGKSLSDLMRGASVSMQTARAYVSGVLGSRRNLAVVERIAAFTGGAVDAAKIAATTEAA